MAFRRKAFTKSTSFQICSIPFNEPAFLIITREILYHANRRSCPYHGNFFLMWLRAHFFGNFLFAKKSCTSLLDKCREKDRHHWTRNANPERTACDQETRVAAREHAGNSHHLRIFVPLNTLLFQIPFPRGGRWKGGSVRRRFFWSYNSWLSVFLTTNPMRLWQVLRILRYLLT